MRLTESIEKANGSKVVDVLARSNGVPPETARHVLDAAVPELAMQLEGNTFSRGRLADLVQALGYGHHEAYLEQPEILETPQAREDGTAILQHILGTPDAVEGAARRISRISGADRATVSQMLPQIAGMAMGGLARETKSRFGDIFSQVPEIGAPAGMRRPSGPGSALPPQQPLPIPDGLPETSGGGWTGGRSRQRSPFDDLSDVIRRKGQAPGGQGNMGSVVLDILGNVLGSSRGGVMTWLIRLVLFRVAWPIVKRIFMRMLLGR